MSARIPTIGVVKFASCDGCQLSLLDLEDHLLEIADTFDIVEFAEATSRRSAGPYDILIVEGSISTEEQAREIVELRSQALVLVTIGACATTGGIQALRNWADHDEFRSAVYANPDYVDSLAMSTSVEEHIPVDGHLHGCPIDRGQLLEFLSAVAVGRRPQFRNEAVCLECKRRGTVCVMVAHGWPCLGPVTHTGCGAICPAMERGCYGCFGPKEAAQTKSLTDWLLANGRERSDVGRLFEGFTAYAEPFRDTVSAFRAMSSEEDEDAPE